MSIDLVQHTRGFCAGSELVKTLSGAVADWTSTAQDDVNHSLTGAILRLNVDTAEVLQVLNPPINGTE